MRHKVISRNKKLMPVTAQEKENVFNPSEYRGIYKDLKIHLDEEINHLRREWIRE